MAIVGAVTDDWPSAVERFRPRTGRELGSVSALVSYWSRRLLNSLLAGRGPIPSWPCHRRRRSQGKTAKPGGGPALLLLSGPRPWPGKTFLPNPRASFEAAVHQASALGRGGRSRNAVGADRRWWKLCASYLYACALPGCRDRLMLTRPGLGGHLGLVAGFALGRNQYWTGWSSSERGTLMAWSIRSARLASASLRLAI
jgi:hypothetical protein